MLKGVKTVLGTNLDLAGLDSRLEIAIVLCWHKGLIVGLNENGTAIVCKNATEVDFVSVLEETYQEKMAKELEQKRIEEEGAKTQSIDQPGPE